MALTRQTTEAQDFDCQCMAHDHDVAVCVQRMLPPENLLYDLADFFKTLGDSTRVRILMALHVRELCVCDLADVLGMTKSAVSHQLRTLRHMRLVRYRREGKNVFYALDDEHVRRVIGTALEHLQHEDAQSMGGEQE